MEIGAAAEAAIDDGTGVAKHNAATVGTATGEEVAADTVLWEGSGLSGLQSRVRVCVYAFCKIGSFNRIF